MIANGVRNSARFFAKCRASSGRGPLPERQDIGVSRVGALCASVRSLGVGIAFVLLATHASGAGVLSESDVKKVEDIKPLFQNLMGDLVQTSKRPDISSGDAECIKSTIQELMQISGELSSYEYLITMEKEMTDFGDHNPMQGVVKFAVDKSNTILASERKRLVQLSDQCTRFPLSYAKTQQALQFIDTTTGILKSIEVRL
jgi:hypothetical protein